MEAEFREEGLTGLIMVDINDIVYTFDFEFTIFQACLQKSVIIPRFCYHNKLSIAGNCRICGVEEKNSSKIIISCATLIDKGSQVHTETELTLQARENVIEFLLINHPLDCPVCDQAGECDLQDQTFLFGADRGRFYENYKRAVENKNFSPLIKFSLNRCIHCARCTRFLSEISESNLFSLLGRGASTEISFYTPRIRAADEMSGNIIDLCPVGALTSKPYAFSARW
jgi:NADH dehydrogenase (ubiquinone) Fe-S protein 1